MLIGISIWWSIDFLKPDTYFNIGDSLFPFSPLKQLEAFFYPWQDSFGEGLGGDRTYADPVSFYYYSGIAFLFKLGTPLWVCNRLFFLIPTWLVLFGSFFMIGAFLKGEGKNISALLGSIFLATSPPLMFITPLLHLAVAGMIISFGALKKLLSTGKVFYLVVCALGFMMMTSMPRYWYLAIVSMGLFVFFWAVLNRKNILRNKKTISKILLYTVFFLVLVVLLNSYSVIPTMIFLSHHNSSELMPDKAAYLDRINVVDFYKGTAVPLYAMRLINNNQYSLYSNYYSDFMNLLVAFALVIFIFSFLVLKREQDIEFPIYALVLTAGVIILLSAMLGMDLYKLLMKIIPGFWIINNPQYILTPLALIYAIFLAFSVQQIYLLPKKSKTDRVRDAQLKTLRDCFVFCVALAIVVNNGIYFFDKTPKARKLFVSGEEDNTAMGNHLPFFKLPEEYRDLPGKLPVADRNARVLVLPSLTDGYMRYAWWPYRTMPDMVGALSSLRLAGVSFGPSRRIKLIKKLICERQFASAADIMRDLGYKYIFVHKDMLAYNYFFDKELETYLSNELTDSGEFKLVEDNDYYRIYKI